MKKTIITTTLLFFVLIIVSTSLASAEPIVPDLMSDNYTDEIFIGYAVGDEQLSVNYYYEFGWTADELEGQDSGGEGGTTYIGSEDETSYTVGDGICDIALGESLLVSPVDCRPRLEEESSSWWIFLVILISLIIYYIYRSKK